MDLDEVEVWVLDSSALIEMKQIVSVSNQWDAFKQLEQMVIDGQIAMPRQVIKEVKEVTHPDMPGAWAPGVRKQLQHPLDAGFSCIRKVMSEAGDILDVNKAGDDADPWVVALALHLKEGGHSVCVVTKDVVDRKGISIATGCDRLQVDWCHVRPFLAHCGIPLLKENKS